MGEHNDSYYQCCCGVHVHTFTFLIALIVVLFWSLCAAGLILYGEYVALLICIPPLFSYGSLLIGNRAGRPSNYCPFLIINLALIIGAFLFAGVSYLTGAAFISHNFNVGIESLETLLGSIGIAIGTGAAIYAFFQFYYFYIVYRDYEYVKSQVAKKVTTKKPRESRQRRFYIDPKKLPKFCPCNRKRSPKKYSIKVDDSDDTDETGIINEKRRFSRTPLTDYNNGLSFPSLNENTALWRSENDLSRSWETRRSSGFSRWPSAHEMRQSKPTNDIWRITTV